MRVLRFLVGYFEEMVAGTFMVLMSLTTFGNVLARYFFNSPIEWAEEFARYAFIWLVFMGAALCSKHKKHIVIDALVVFMPGRVQRVFALLVDVATLGLMLVMAYYGWVLIGYADQPTATLKVPQYVVYWVVPLSAVLILLYTLGDLRRDLRSVLSGGE